MNTTTEIERDQTNLPLHLQVERDYVQTIGLMLAIDAATPGLFGDMEERQREHAAGLERLEAEGVELRAFTDAELLNVFARLVGLAMSSGGMAAVLERYRNEMGMT